MVWVDWPGSGVPDRIPTAAAGRALRGTSWWDQIHGLRGWGGFYGPGGTGAFYVHLPAPPLARWLPVLAVLAAGGGLLRRWHTRGAPRPWRALALLVALGYLVQLTGLWLQADDPGSEVTARTYSRGYGGYVVAADRAGGLSTFFGEYERLLRTHHGDDLCPIHCGTHPPGAVLPYWVAIRALRALPDAPVRSAASFASDELHGDLPASLSTEGGLAAWGGGHLTMLLAALIVLPLFGLARRLAGERLALPLAALGLVTPAMLHFAPVYDQLWALAAATLLYVALRGLADERHATAWGLVAGAVLAIATYGSFNVLVLAVVLAAMAVAALAGRLPAGPAGAARASRRHLVGWLAGLAVATALPWLVAWAAGLDVPGVAAAARANHEASTLASRPYWPWAAFNLGDYLQLLGLPLAAVAIAAGARRRSRGAAWNVYGVAFVGLTAALTLSGGVKGETGRIWLFLTPLALAAVYDAVGRRLIRPRTVAFLLAAEALLAVVIQARWSYTG
jgi:hypothetical protein